MKWLSLSQQYYQRITANKVAPLIQLQTSFFKFFLWLLPESPHYWFKSFYFEAALQWKYTPEVTKHDSRNSWKRTRQNSKTQQVFERTNRTGETKETHLEATKVLRAAYADFKKKDIFLSAFLHRLELSIDLKGRRLLVTGWLPCFKISRQPVWWQDEPSFICL